MIVHRSLIAAVLAAAAAAPAAQAQEPTLQWDRQCYTEDQQMNFTGAGFTPGAQVQLAFSNPGGPIGSHAATADPAGALADYVFATSALMLEHGQSREQIQAAATDSVDVARSAPSAFTFTDWAGYSPGRYVPGRKARVEIYGWAFAEGRTAYLLFRQRHRTVASVNLGRIAGPCGDLAARVKAPRKLRAGTYMVWLSTARRTPSRRATWRTARVARKAAAHASRLRRMRRS